IEAACRLDYPRDRLQIQILDDSTDETGALARAKAGALRAQGFDIVYIHRGARDGFKAGALAHGLKTAAGELVAVFDADFLPPADFLRRTVPHFADPRIGMVQTRWGHVNAEFSLLTRLQSLFLDGHFMLEHTARNRSGLFINFNGTAGVWRRAAVDDAGGWSADTLTEDLDLSYRAQLAGWRFLFLPEVVCPAELPVDMGAFRSQQHRWTKGALQVARKTLPRLWRSEIPFRVKLESTAHLTANLAYPLVLALSLFILPSLPARHALEWPFLAWLEPGIFVFAAVSIALFYWVAHRESSPTRLSAANRWRWRDVPALMAFGIGMCLNNTRAAWEAFTGAPSEFHRTPKFNVVGRRGAAAWRSNRYRLGGRRAGLPEAVLAAYSLAAVLWSVNGSAWASLPFIALFAGGYGYIGALTLSHGRKKNQP
ncbi:MAG: glycosyltransferase family 2 protein, partial [Elusimicrobiota bacterium]